MIPNSAINVSVSNHYAESSHGSEVTSQGCLGEPVEMLEQCESFTRISQADGYESWISTDQLYQGKPPVGSDIRVRSHFIRIYQDPSTTSVAIRDAVIGCQLKTVNEEGGWYQIVLPDGLTGWAEKQHFAPLPGFSAENVITLAREFLGYQYAWGGCSPKGFDCSGFVQTIFRLHGLLLPRDAWQQQQQKLLSTGYQEAQPADLLFFGKTPERATHVAIALGNGRFIHASGWVKHNSLKESDPDFSRRHLDTFISVNRYAD